jgi:Protein of unknown function (DUF2953)
MGLVMWIILLVVIGLVVIAWTFIEVKIIAKRDHRNDQLTIEAKGLWGLIKFRYDIPTIKFIDLSKGILFKEEQINENTDSKMKASSESLNKRSIKQYFKKTIQLKKSTTEITQWIKELMSHMECLTFSWNSRIGLDDASMTAQAVGVVWGIKSMIVSYIIRYVQMKNVPQLEVMPQYNVLDYSTEIKVTCRIRIIHLLKAAFNLLIRILRKPKGFQGWKKVLLKRS